MSTNDITGDKLQTKTTTDAYRDGWEAIFGKKDAENELDKTEKEQEENTACTK